MVTRLRTKIVEIEAVLWTGDNLSEVITFLIHNRGTWSYINNELKVWNKLEKQWCNVPVGHYVLKGLEDEFYPFEQNACLKKYEVLDD